MARRSANPGGGMGARGADGEHVLRLTARPLECSDWPVVTRLFGGNGACGGCWCMHWRMQRGADWDALKGRRNRDALRRLVQAGRVHAVLAFHGEQPVGWCLLGPRSDFLRLMRSRVMNPQAHPDTWAVLCFFIPAAWRRRGVAGALLAEAVQLARARGARRLEGYPVPAQGRDGKPYPATFAYTGVPRLFARAGFREPLPAGGLGAAGRGTREATREATRESPARPVFARVFRARRTQEPTR